VTKNQQGRGQAGNLLMVNRFSDKKYLRVKPGRKKYLLRAGAAGRGIS